MVVDSCRTNPLDRYFMVNNAADHNDKPVQEALAEGKHSDHSLRLGYNTISFACDNRSSYGKLALTQ